MVRTPRVFRRRRARLGPPRLPGLTVNRLLPNLLTLSALASGMTGMRFAIEGRFAEAVVAIAIAAILDGLDGRIARMLNAQSKFGEELDSLADVVSFGVAPAMILYQWSLSTAGTIGWIAALMLGVCAALRLARFNTMLGAAAEKPPWAYNYFTGVPTPAAAGLALLPLIATLEVGPGWFDKAWLVAPWTIMVAALMISAVPTFSLKGMRVPQAYVVFVLLGAGVLVAALVSATWATLALLLLAYVISLPFSYWRYLQLQHAAEALTADEGETPPPPEAEAPKT